MTSKLKVKAQVKPGSKKGPLIEATGPNSYLIYVPERAVEGAANQAATELIAKHFKVAKTRVSLVGGAKSKLKLFEIN